MTPYHRHPVALAATAALALAASPAWPQTSSIALDGTLPNGRTDVLTTPGSGPAYQIDQTMGEASGSNLFHSFKTFSIGVGESATFTATSAFDNVIARVTGRDPATGVVAASPSQIDGALRSEVAGADVFLLNPWGVLFGPNGTVDVPTSLHVSTAHALRFAGGASLSLVDPEAPVLSSAAPEAFGFFAGREAADVVFAAFPGFTSNVAVKTGATLSVSAGDVTATNRVFLRAPSGRVQLAALGSAGAEVPLDFAEYHPDPAAAAALGEVVLADGATAIAVPTAVDAPQGTVVIRGGRFGLTSSTSAQSTVRAGDLIGGAGPSIDVEVAGEVEIAGAALLRAEGQGANPSGGARIEADLVRVTDGARVESRVAGPALGGDLVIEARAIEVESGGQLVTATQGSQAGGDLVVRGRTPGEAAESVTLDGGQILSTATSSGAGGDIGIEAGSLVARDGRISASSSALAAGGGIEIEAGQVDLLDGSQVASTNQITAAPAPDPIPGGGVAIRAPDGRLRIADGASVATVSSGPHPGGSIELVAETLEVADGGGVEASARAAGAGGSDWNDADRVELFRSRDGVAAVLVSAVVAPNPGAPSESASGAGGSIAVTAGSVALRDGGQLSTTTEGSGDAGSISVVATGDVELAGEQPGAGGPEPSGFFSRSETSADGGSVSVSAQRIEVVDGAEISTRAIAGGDSGDVALTAQQAIRVAGEGTQGSVVTARGIDGSGGDVALTAPRVEVLDGGSVDVSTSGAGQGGTLEVVADEVRVAGASGSGLRASLAAEAGGSGDAGGVHLIVTDELRIGKDGQITVISRGLGGSPGDVLIEGTGVVIVEDGGLINAESRDLQLAETATPGSVRMVDVGRLTVRNGGEISVRGLGLGDGGDLSVEAKTIEIRHGTLTAEAAGVGGNIDLVATKLVHIADSVVTATASAGAAAPPGTRGGNITIDPPAVVINRSQIEARGEGLADGGNFSVVASAFLLSADSSIDVSSEFGVAGTVVVDAPQAEIAGDLGALPADFLDASALLEAACLARDQAAGSFAVRGASALPASPDAPLSARTGTPDAGGACPAP